LLRSTRVLAAVKPCRRIGVEVMRKFRTWPRRPIVVRTHLASPTSLFLSTGSAEAFALRSQRHRRTALSISLASVLPATTKEISFPKLWKSRGDCGKSSKFLVATGICLLLEASARQTAGVALLAFAPAWLMGSLSARILGIVAQGCTSPFSDPYLLQEERPLLVLHLLPAKNLIDCSVGQEETNRWPLGLV